MENILYLDEYINYYDKKYGKIIKFKPYKKTLKNGIIIDSKKFLKSFEKLKKAYKIANALLNEKLILIINSNYSIDDKNKIKDLLEELNYKQIEIINEITFLKINKNNLYINYNESYFNIYYLDNEKVKLINYENNNVNKSLVINILKKINKENIIILGKNYQELINIFKKTNCNYYFYEESDNLFIKIYLKNKSV